MSSGFSPGKKRFVLTTLSSEENRFLYSGMTQIKLSGDYCHSTLAEFLRGPNAEASGRASCTAQRTVSLSIGWRDLHVVRRSRSTSRVLRSSVAAPVSGLGGGGSGLHG